MTRARALSVARASEMPSAGRASGIGSRGDSARPVSRLARRLLSPSCQEVLAKIAGVITTKHVLLHSPIIVHDFGLRTWLGCWKALLIGRRAPPPLPGRGEAR